MTQAGEIYERLAFWNRRECMAVIVSRVPFSGKASDVRRSGSPRLLQTSLPVLAASTNEHSSDY